MAVATALLRWARGDPRGPKEVLAGNLKNTAAALEAINVLILMWKLKAKRELGSLIHQIAKPIVAQFSLPGCEAYFANQCSTAERHC